MQSIASLNCNVIVDNLYTTDVPASAVYFMTYEWLQHMLTPEGKSWVYKAHEMNLCYMFRVFIS